MFGIGTSELILVFVIILLLFGAKRLPEIARSLGKSIGEFKKAKEDFVNYTDKAAEEAKKDDKKETASAPAPEGSDKSKPSNS